MWMIFTQAEQLEKQLHQTQLLLLKPMKTSASNALIKKMLQTFEDLGNDPMARIDARLWHKHYTKVARKLKIIPPAAKGS